MKRFFFLILFSFFFTEARPSQIDKGYKALRIYDYFKAKEIFYKQLKKHPAEASFGLATIFYRNDNPFHQLDSSYKYINICKNHWQIFSPEKRSSLKMLYQISDSTIVTLHDSISEKAYLKFINHPTIESSEKYLQTYFQSVYNKKVICLRDSFAFTKLKTHLSSTACKEYIFSYPQSCYLQEAVSLNEYSIYTETTSARDDKGYLTYLEKFPKGKYLQLAKEELLNYYMEHRDAKNIYGFIKQYQMTYPTTYAWNALLGIEVPNRSKAELETFLSKYPDYPLKNDIEEEFKFWHTPFFIIKKGDKIGFCDSTGKIMIEPQFSEAEDFNEEYALVQKNDLYGYINKPGKIKIDFQFSEATPFSNHVAIVQKDKLYYLIDYSNKTLSYKYDEISDFSEGMAVAKKNNWYGIINQNGEEIVKPLYENLSDYSEGLAAFYKNGTYGFIDKQGFTVIAPLFSWASSFKNGRCRVQYNKYYGLINKKGDFVIQPSYDMIDEASKGIYLVVKNNLYGFIDSSGCLLSEIKYIYNPSLKAADLANQKFMRLISLKKQDLQSVNGYKYFSEQNFAEVMLPVNNLVRVKEKNKYSVYNLGKSSFAKKAAPVIYTDKKYWYLETKKGINVYDIGLNKILFLSEADKITAFGTNYFLTETEEGKGLLDLNGTEILLSLYDEIKTTSLPNLVYIERNEKGAYFNISTRSFIWKEEGF